MQRACSRSSAQSLQLHVSTLARQLRNNATTALRRKRGRPKKEQPRPQFPPLGSLPAKEQLKALLPARPYLENPERLATLFEVLDRRLAIKGYARTPTKWSSPTLANDDTIKAVIEKSHLKDYAGKTIIEISPGPGILAEKLIEMVKPARYIALEPRSTFMPVLETLKDPEWSNHNTDLHFRPADGFAWQSYTALEDEGLLDFNSLSHPRDEINPNLVFIATAKSQNMDQLVAQWIDTIGTNSWLQKFGRVRMYLFVSRPIRQRLLAQPGSPFRTKGTFIREATCDIKEILLVPYTQDKVRSSAQEHWKQDFKDLPQSRDAIVVRPDHYHPPTALSLLEVNPFEKPLITASWDTFDYLTKILLMNQSTPLYKQVRGIASGAYAILAALTPALRLKRPQHMTVHDLNEIALAFDKWPFRPKYLHTELYLADNKRSAENDMFTGSAEDPEESTSVLGTIELPRGTSSTIDDADGDMEKYLGEGLDVEDELDEIEYR